MSYFIKCILQNLIRIQSQNLDIKTKLTQMIGQNQDRSQRSKTAKLLLPVRPWYPITRMSII